MLEAIQDQWPSDVKQASAQRAYDRTAIRPVEPGEGNTETPFKFDLLGWTQMEEGLVIRGIEQGGGFRGGEEGYEPVRNSVFKKFSTRSMRPVINFETCIKCTLCWLQCPDTCFDVYARRAVRRQHGIMLRLRRVRGSLPVPDCVTMVNEAEFNDNNSQWEAWQKDQTRLPAVDDFPGGEAAHPDPHPRIPSCWRVRRGCFPGGRIMTTVQDQSAQTSREELISGSEAIAIACSLADVDVITAYPIRPYDTVMQYVSKLKADGAFDCDFIVAESEHSQFEIVKHASAVGARTFCGSSGVGWFYAFEAITVTAGLRMPVVAMVGNRGVGRPRRLWRGTQRRHGRAGPWLDALLGSHGAGSPGYGADGLADCRRPHGLAALCPFLRRFPS